MDIKGRILGAFRSEYRKAKAAGDRRTMRLIVKRIEHDAHAVAFVTE